MTTDRKSYRKGYTAGRHRGFKDGEIAGRSASDFRYGQHELYLRAACIEVTESLRNLRALARQTVDDLTQLEETHNRHVASHGQKPLDDRVKATRRHR